MNSFIDKSCPSSISLHKWNSKGANNMNIKEKGEEAKHIPGISLLNVEAPPWSF
jgi:hypothetical protein